MKIRRHVPRRHRVWLAESESFVCGVVVPRGVELLEFGAPLPERLIATEQGKGRRKVSIMNVDLTVPDFIAERLRAVAESRGITELEALGAALTLGAETE